MEEKYLVQYLPGTKWNERKGAMYRHMECKICGQMSKCGEDTTSVTCSDCVSEGLNAQFGGPDVTLKKSTGRPNCAFNPSETQSEHVTDVVSSPHLDI